MKKDEMQLFFSDWLIRDLYSTITTEDLVEIKGPNVWFHKGVEMRPEEIRALKSQAETFKQSLLWRVMRSGLYDHATKQLAHKASEPADLVAGRVAIYLTSVIEEFLDETQQN